MLPQNEAKEEQDILYNKDKFESGEINLCFVTGLPGSGKTTLSQNMSDVEHYELDDVLANYNFSDENLKEYGDLISSFFKSSGSKYRLKTKEDLQKQPKEYDYSITQAFVKYAISYSKQHLDKKFVIEGVELYWCIEPRELDKYAVYIKNTSALKSYIRAASRDSKNTTNDKLSGMVEWIKMLTDLNRLKRYRLDSKLLDKWINYYKPKTSVEINEANANVMKLYFVSEKPNLTTLPPRVPDNWLIKNGYEDGVTKRVCFAPSIDKCLIALSSNLTNKQFYVYQPDGNYDIVTPTSKQVPDSKITSEKWITSPVKVKCIGKITITGDDGKDGMKYTYGDNRTAELYGWNWKWIEKYSINESSILEATNANQFKYANASTGRYDEYLKQDATCRKFLDYIHNECACEICYDEKNKKLIGYIFIDKNKNPGFIASFYVMKAYRKLGIGSKLLKTAISKHGAIDLVVDKSNKSAIKLYKKFGFVTIGQGNSSSQYWMKLKNKLEKDEEEIMESTSNITTLPVVYFTKEITPESIVNIYKALKVNLNGKVAVKISTGEAGNNHYLKPELIGDIVRELNGTIVECNTAYPGSKRSDSHSHWKVIHNHGFDKFPVDILDEYTDMEIPVNGGFHLQSNRVGFNMSRYDSVLVLSHAKGHVMGGYGAALKNISIGFASKEGKVRIHTAGTSTDFDDTNRIPKDDFTESMADAAKSIIDHFGSENMVYINIANNISIDCDCDAHPHKPEIPDIGIFASTDPVAVDQAYIDYLYNLDNPKKKSLIDRLEDRKGKHILEAAEQLGLGSREYTLIDISPSVDITQLLDSTPPHRIFLTSDWHYFHRRYKKEQNPVNPDELHDWCMKNITDNDVFIYLGDMCFRYATDADNAKVKEKFKQLPGKKILVLGNHDIVAGEDFYLDCGFDYVVKDIHYRDLLFTHRPEDVRPNPAIKINICGHIHKWSEYNTTDGKANINVYPFYYGNKPTTLNYVLNHVEKLTKDNKRSNWIGMGESAMLNSAFKDSVSEETKLVTESLINTIFYGLSEELMTKPIAPRLCVDEGGVIFGHHDGSEIDAVVDAFNESLESQGYTNYHVFNVGRSLYFTSYDVDQVLSESTVNRDRTVKLEHFKIKSINDKNLRTYLKYSDRLMLEHTKGYIYINENDDAVAMVNVKYTEDGRNVIHSLCVNSALCDDPKAITRQLIETAVNKLNASSIVMDVEDFEVNREQAKLFEEFGFVRYETTLPNCCEFVYNTDDKIIEETEMQISNLLNGILPKKKSAVSEYSAAAMNPIPSVGFDKPYLLVLSKDEQLISNKVYALSPELISGKYLVVNESGILEYVDAESFAEYYIVGCYQYKGHKYNLDKLNAKYKACQESGKQVTPNCIYTTLSGYILLTEDQIDTDDVFEKIDLELYSERIRTEAATNVYKNMQITSNGCALGIFSVMENTLYNSACECIDSIMSDKNISVMESLSGYYLINGLTHKVTRTVKSLSDITDTMLKSTY